MKNKKIVLLLLSVCSISFGSCSQDNPEPTPEPEPPSVYYNVFFDSAGGSDVPPQTVISGGKIAKPDDPQKTGYSFTKWTYNGQAWSFDINVVNQNMTLVANWNPNSYRLTILSDNDDAGQITASGDYVYNTTVTINAQANTGYEFLGWFDDNDNLISEYSQYSFTMGLEKTIIAHWECISYTIGYELDGGTNSDTNPNSYTVEQEVVFSDPSKENYEFLGWFDSAGNKIENIKKGTTGDINIFAHWRNLIHGLTVISNDDNKGTVEIVSGTGKEGDSVVVKATPIGDCLFTGWYVNSIRVCVETQYSFIMPQSDFEIEARFITKIEDDIAKGKIPYHDEKTDVITYGLYPQTVVSDEALIDELQSIENPVIVNGWHFYGNDYYAKAKSVWTGHYFSDGTRTLEDKEYWFKCEPIRWASIQINLKTCMLAKNVLGHHCFSTEESTRTIEGKTIYPNNYKYSEIREYLIGDFYNTAFFFDNDNLKNVTVKNICPEDSKFTSEDTTDKVFLLSMTEFRGLQSEEVIGTDYAVANGLDTITHNYSSYWTRTAAESVYDADGKSAYSYKLASSNAILCKAKLGIRPTISFI